MSNQRVAYLRLSSEDGDNESLSITNQRKIVAQFAAEHDYEIVETFIDDGFTGYTFDRPAFKRLQQDIEDGLIEGIIVKDLSRIGRHNAKVNLFIEELTMRGIEFISIGDDYNNLTDDDALIGIKTWYNERMIKDTSKKIRQVIHSKQKEGKWICNIPYGYKKDYSKKASFTVDEITSQYVRKLFDLYVNGHGGHTIAKIFNDEGIPTPTQRTQEIKIESGLEPSKRPPATMWSNTLVQRIISNEFYIGTLVQRKTQIAGIHGKCVKRDKEDYVVFEDHHEPIIDKDTFYLAQKLKKERATKHHKGVRKHNNLFVGLVFCGKCGKPMTPRSGAHGRRYYVCTTYNSFGSKYCDYNRIYEDELIEFIKVYLRQCRNSLESAIKNLDIIIQDELKQVYNTNIIDSITSLKKEYERNTKELRGLMEQKVKDIINNPAIKEIIEETYQKSINEKSNYVQSLKIQLEERQEAAKSTKDIQDGLNKALLLFDNIITTEKITVKQLKLLIDKIVIHYNSGADVYMNGNLNEVIQNNVEAKMGTIDSYKKAVINTLFEMKEFYLKDVHRAVFEKGYAARYYNTFLPIINKLESAGIVIRTPGKTTKNYVVGNIEDAYSLFNLYTEDYIASCQRIFNVSFAGLLKICRWVRHAA